MDARTARLEIRRLTDTDADAEFVLRLLNDASFIHAIADRGVRTREQAREYLQAGPLASYAQHGHGLYRVALIDFPARPGLIDFPARPGLIEGPAIGLCGLVQREQLTGPDLGYALLPEFTGHGYALEAARAVLEFASSSLGLTTIQAVVKPSNARSIHLLGKLGFVRIGQVALSAELPADALFERVTG